MKIVYETGFFIDVENLFSAPLIKNKTEYFKNCFKPNNPELLRHFEQMQDALRKNISKQKHYLKLSRKLAVNKINPKCYRPI